MEGNAKNTPSHESLEQLRRALQFFLNYTVLSSAWYRPSNSKLETHCLQEQRILNESDLGVSQLFYFSSWNSSRILESNPPVQEREIFGA